MPGRTTARKYTPAQEGAFRVEIIDILSCSEDAMTIEEIQLQSPMVLGGATSQKLSRVLSNLIEMGLVRKTRSKQKNRMVYKAVSKMIEQGYSVDGDE